MFTPDKAFEETVQKQIEKLLEPSIKCVDMVSQELGQVIKQCAEHVRKTLMRLVCDSIFMVLFSLLFLQMVRYPRLRDETETKLLAFLREQEEQCKEHIRLMIRIELSYMNTNHPDFIGYHKLAL